MIPPNNESDEQNPSSTDGYLTVTSSAMSLPDDTSLNDREGTAASPSLRCPLLDLPPELRNLVYEDLLHDFREAFQSAALKFMHEEAVRTLGPYQRYANNKPQKHFPVRPTILSAHPVLRHEFAPMYRSELIQVWMDHATLSNEKTTRFTDLLAAGCFEPSSYHQLDCIIPFGHDLADWIIQELSHVGLEQLTYGQRFCCRELARSWAARKEFKQYSVELGGWRHLDDKEREVTRMQGRVTFATSMLESFGFGARARVVVESGKHGVGYR